MFKIFCFLIFPVLSTGKLAVLHEDTWSEILTDEWMFILFAPWCPAYKQLEPVWKLFAEWSDDLKVGSVDVTVNPGLSSRFPTETLPVIFHVKDGVFRQYNGSKSLDGFISFIKGKEWQKIDPVPSFKSPQSLLISFYVSLFYGLPNTLAEKYGLPRWGLRILFGLSLMLIGVLLGLSLIIANRFFQSRTGFQPPKGPSTPGGREHEEYNVIRNDVAEDPGLRRRGVPANEQENETN